MRRLTSLEKTLLILSAVFLMAGIWALLFPREFVYPGVDVRFQTPVAPVQFSKNEFRVYGALSMTVGLCLGGLAFYPLKR